MRVLSTIVAILLMLVGCVWLLQGINVIPGSFMTGQTKWALIGGLCIVAGFVLLFSMNRSKS